MSLSINVDKLHTQICNMNELYTEEFNSLTKREVISPLSIMVNINCSDMPTEDFKKYIQKIQIKGHIQKVELKVSY